MTTTSDTFWKRGKDLNPAAIHTAPQQQPFPSQDLTIVSSSFTKPSELSLRSCSVMWGSMILASLKTHPKNINVWENLVFMISMSDSIYNVHRALSNGHDISILRPCSNHDTCIFFLNIPLTSILPCQPTFSQLQL